MGGGTKAKDSAQRVLWHKLTVHGRVQKTSGTDKCLICARKEVLRHATIGRSMSKVVAAVIRRYYGKVSVGGHQVPIREAMETAAEE